MTKIESVTIYAARITSSFNTRKNYCFPAIDDQDAIEQTESFIRKLVKKHIKKFTGDRNFSALLEKSECSRYNPKTGTIKPVDLKTVARWKKQSQADENGININGTECVDSNGNYIVVARSTV